MSPMKIEIIAIKNGWLVQHAPVGVTIEQLKAGTSIPEVVSFGTMQEVCEYMATTFKQDAQSDTLSLV